MNGIHDVKTIVTERSDSADTDRLRLQGVVDDLTKWRVV